ncbi:hypothetical protein N752_13375 [Desulforamulus aquiferis]|nr:hypothetical protein [Desulforamulus aquiferis]RYD04359.1 hypothetical protein N752_13375 [Desulforamulus aquiferis]
MIRIRNLLKSEKGIAMIAALITGFIVVVISGMFWQASSSRTIHATRNENQAQAFFFARSGVDAAVGLLQTKGFFPYDSFPITYNGDLVTGFKKGDGDDYSIKFTISEVAGGLKIESEGRVRGAQGAESTAEDLTLLLPGWSSATGKPTVPGDNGAGGGSFTFDYAVFTRDNISIARSINELNGSAWIEGPVGTNRGKVVFGNSTSCKIMNSGSYPGVLYLGPGATVNKPERVRDGVVNFSPEKQFPEVPEIPSLPLLPDYPDYPGYPGYISYPNTSGIAAEQINVNNNITVNLNPGLKLYNSIRFDYNKTLTFNLNGDATVVVKEITNSSGHLNISGQGKLTLVVEKTLIT